jgi:hypothetical protein
MTNARTTEVLRLEPDAVSWREVDGEIVALDLRSGEYLAINATGSTLWAMLAEGATGPELTSRLIERYDLARDRAERDASAFVRELDIRGLIVRDLAS